jgi:hypothetical protein
VVKAAAAPGMSTESNDPRQPEQARCVHDRPRAPQTRPESQSQASDRRCAPRNRPARIPHTISGLPPAVYYHIIGVQEPANGNPGLQLPRHGRTVDQGGQGGGPVDPAFVPRLRCNAVRLQLHALAYNLGTFMRTLALPEGVDRWSLTTLRGRPVKAPRW